MRYVLVCFPSSALLHDRYKDLWFIRFGGGWRLYVSTLRVRTYIDTLTDLSDAHDDIPSCRPSHIPE